MKKIKVGLIQRPIKGSISKEIDITCQLIGEIAKKGGELICLAEFSFRRWFLHQLPEPGTKLSLLSPSLMENLIQVSEKHNCYIHFVDAKEEEGQLYNTAFLICPDGNIFYYYKRHIPNLPGFRESAWYKPGIANAQVFRIPLAKIGMLTCSDVMFPEETKALGKSGADLILLPRATLAVAIKRWEIMLCANAIISGAYVVSVNRIGSEYNIAFAGHSTVISPFGEVILDMGEHNGFEIVEIDLNQAIIAKQRYPVCMNIP